MTIREILTTLDYGPAPENAQTAQDWLADHAPGVGHFIGGAFTDFVSDGATVAKNPATAELLLSVSTGTAADVDAAVVAAQTAFAAWSARPGVERARFLYAIARHIQKRERFLSVLETLDNGKPIRESRDADIPLAARHFYHHAGWATAIADDFPDHAPHGVCAQIIPWNFPLLMLAWKIAPALAAGNTVVLKPAEQTPLSAIAFAEICAEVGLPAGVVNIVQGDGTTGAALVDHPGVAKIAFTGSTEVGRAIRRATAGSGKALTLELGGKSPFIVFDSADLDAAVEGVVDGIWFNGGQVCCAGSRLIVQESVADRFHDALRRRLASLRVGDPLDKSTDIGPIVSAEQLTRITGLVQTGVAEGGTLHANPGDLPSQGHWCAPGFLTGVSPSATVAQTEIFGPVATSFTFRTPAEAIELANNTAYGLAASIWAQDIDTAMDAAAQVKAGVVWINGTNLFDAGAPFGGMRESGFGREGGRAGIAAYLKRPGAAAPPQADRVDFNAAPAGGTGTTSNAAPPPDRTLKLYVGGKHVRPDGGASYAVRDLGGVVIGQAGLGNRKDVRNAVEAAHKATGWTEMSGHQRAQVLYFMAENLSLRADQFAQSLRVSGADPAEVPAAVDRLFTLAGMGDKLDGRVHSTRARHVTLAMNEVWGVVGLVCPTVQPLLSLVTTVGALIAMGNRVVAVPDPRQALLAGDLAQLCDSSDVPGGVVNLISGNPAELTPVLAAHDDVDALWQMGDPALTARAETEAAGNLKPVFSHVPADWNACDLRALLHDAVQVKTIWVPYGA